MKSLMTAVALMTLAASPAFSATYHSRVSAQPNGNNAYAAAYDNGGMTGGSAVVSNGKYLGSDPDPAIRFGLLRQGDQTAGSN